MLFNFMKCLKTLRFVGFFFQCIHFTFFKCSAVPSQFVHLVMQYCEGNDLFSRVTERKFFTEPEAAVICQKVASVLDFAHSKGIMHRDIKLENILMVSNAIDTDIRVADFGSAALFCAEEKLSKFIGSPYYVSPSVIKGSYGSEADLWSLGVVLYILLSGVPPFFGKSRAETIGAVLNNPLNLRAGKLASVSADAKDLLTNLLSRNTQEIISASQVLRMFIISEICSSNFFFTKRFLFSFVSEHPWIQKHTYGDPYIFDKRTPTSFSFFGGKPTCSVDVASAYKENFLPSCGHTGEEGSTAGRGILQLSKAQSGWDQAEEHVTTIYKDCASCSLP